MACAPADALLDDGGGLVLWLGAPLVAVFDGVADDEEPPPPLEQPLAAAIVTSAADHTTAMRIHLITAPNMGEGPTSDRLVNVYSPGLRPAPPHRAKDALGFTEMGGEWTADRTSSVRWAGDQPPAVCTRCPEFGYSTGSCAHVMRCENAANAFGIRGCRVLRCHTPSGLTCGDGI